MLGRRVRGPTSGRRTTRRAFAARLANDERGAAAVVFAILLVVLLAVSALVLDLGMAFQVRRQAQNAADSAAAAAVREITSGSPNSVARSYVNRNGFDGSSPTATIVNHPPASGEHSGDPECVEVLTGKSVSTFFAGVIGFDTVDVSARAVACVTDDDAGKYAILAGATSCTKAVDWSGSTTDVKGRVHSNDGIHIGGSSILIEGQVTYRTTIHAPPGNVTFVPSTGNPEKVTDPIAYPVNFKIEDYAPGGSRASLAGSNYHYAGGSKIDMGWLKDRGLWNDTTKTLTPGLYYSTADIDISASDIIGAGVTFVSKSGVVSLSGSSHQLTPWDPEGLLIFSDYMKASPQTNQTNCGAPGAKLSGSTHSWQGIVYTPRSQAEMSGSSNTTFSGSLMGWSVKLNGSVLFVDTGSEFLRVERVKLVE